MSIITVRLDGKTYDQLNNLAKKNKTNKKLVYKGNDRIVS